MLTKLVVKSYDDITITARHDYREENGYEFEEAEYSN